MAIFSQKAGPGTIRAPKKVSTVLPSLISLAFTASALAGGTTNNNAPQHALRAGTNYQVILACVGWDSTTDGYSVGVSTPSTGVLTVASNGDAIQVRVPLANWPANFDKSGFIAVFLAVGSGGFQPVLSVPIDSIFTGRAFECIIDHEPLSEVEQYSMATLTSTSNNGQKGLGDRLPKGFTFSTVAPTTDSTNIRFKIGNSITFSPNSSSDYTGVGSRPVGLDYKIELNDLETIIAASAGNSSSATLSSGSVLKQGAQGLNSANVFLKGNQPVIFISPVDPSTGASDISLFTGLTLQNSVELALAWSKKSETPVTVNYTVAPVDYFTIGQDTYFSFNIH